MYTTTADEHFILERRGKVVIGSACSGHGFKFAPAVGTRRAAMATDILLAVPFYQRPRRRPAQAAHPVP